MNIATSITQLIGNTPLLQLCRFSEKYALDARFLAKLEYFNPLGSTKDRAAHAMILAGERSGAIRQGTVIVESTSGNTGVGLAFICATRGYRLILTMPETMSLERRSILAALGAEIDLTPGALGMKGAIDRAAKLCEELPNAFMPLQFENPANPQSHYETTGPEIWRDTNGEVDILVATFGTGGTISGIAAALKERRPDIRIVGVEPAASPVVSGGQAGPHKIQGIGAGFIPKNLNTGLLDEVVCVSDADAYATTCEAAQLEGLFVGISSGAALCAAAEIAKRPECKGKTIVVVLPDGGERYLSAGVFPPVN